MNTETTPVGAICPLCADCHTHSGYSHDTRVAERRNIDALCHAAYEKGLSYLAVTDHFDADYQRAGKIPRMPFEEIDRDLREAKETWSGRLYPAYGIEYGQPYASPEDFDSILRKYPYDIVLGSVHSPGNFEGFSHRDFRTMTREEIDHTMERYLDAWEKLVHTDDDTVFPAKIDIYTHPTYPLRYLLRQGVPYDENLWEERMRGMLRVIVEKGAGTEFNTAYLRNPGILPDDTAVTVLRWYRECGGEIVTAASDAHKPEDIAADFAAAKEILESCGFSYYAEYRERKPIFHRL